MKKVTIVLLLLSQFSLFTQNYKFGKVSKEELQEQFYPLDSNADAVYLFKSRRTFFDYAGNNGLQLITEYHERIKIYTNEGFEMATKSIPYYTPEVGEDEAVRSIKGYTFNLEGNNVEREKLSSKSIFKESPNKFRSVKKITMPKIKEGCVIELRYKIISPYYQSIEDLKFQYQIPVKKLDYKVEIPEYFVFNKRSYGYYFVKTIPEYKNGRIGNIGYSINITSFDESNIPALKNDEPFVSNVHNYRSGMKFELTQMDFTSIGGDLKIFSSNWENVSKQIYKASSFGNELNKSSYYKEDLEKILKENKIEVDRILAIFQFVKGKVKWNGYYGIYSDNGVRKAYKERVGNVADINLMLTSMLRSAGLNADPVLVSTRSNGVPLFPTIDGFNYVISVVKLSTGGSVLLDATEKYSVPNILPTRVVNWNGRKVEKDGASSWVKLTSSKHALEDNNLSVKISDDGLVEGVLRSKFSNLKALNYRENKNHLKEDVLRSQLEEKYTIEIDEFKLLNKNKLSKPVFERVKFSSEDLVEEINGKLYVEPLLFFANSTNPFKLEDRKFPVDFVTPWKDVHRVSIQIPEGYKIEILPEKIAIGMPEDLGVFKFQTSRKGNKIYTVCILQFNSAIIVPQYYGVLKEFYAKVVEKQSEKIVLVKI
jgi:hypothetical protein